MTLCSWWDVKLQALTAWNVHCAGGNRLSEVGGAAFLHRWEHTWLCFWATLHPHDEHLYCGQWKVWPLGVPSVLFTVGGLCGTEVGQAACNRGNTRYFAMVSRCIALQFCLFASGGMWHYNLLVFNMGWMAQFNFFILFYMFYSSFCMVYSNIALRQHNLFLLSFFCGLSVCCLRKVHVFFWKSARVLHWLIKVRFFLTSSVFYLENASQASPKLIWHIFVWVYNLIFQDVLLFTFWQCHCKMNVL